MMVRAIRALGSTLLLIAALTCPVPGRAGATDVWQAAGVAKIREGIEAPGFTLPDLGGRAVSLSAFRGRLVLLYFWATW